MKLSGLLPLPNGVGGQGAVQVGYTEDGSSVAVKFMLIRENEEETAHFLRRFAQEVDVQRGLEHPAIMPILFADTNAFPPYFVMPRAEKSLRELLDDHDSTEGEAVAHFRRILSAVSYAHQNEVIHRDIKPENVLLLNGQLVLADFGLGRNLFSTKTGVTRTRARGGSDLYAAPEQLRDLRSVAKAADVFSLGQLFYELLTGRQAAIHFDSRLVPHRFRSLIHRAREENPEERFQDAISMEAEFSELLASFDGGNPEADVTSLIRSIHGGEAKSATTLLKLLRGPNSSKESRLALIGVQRDVLQALAHESSLGFGDVVAQIVADLDPEVPERMTKSASFFLLASYEIVTSIRLREQLLVGLVRLYSLNKGWYVRDRLTDALNYGADKPSLVEMAENVWRTHRALVSTYGQDFYARLEPNLASGLREAMRFGPHQ